MKQIEEIKCNGCGKMRKWWGYECLTFCDCLADKIEDDETDLLDEDDCQITHKDRERE